MREPEFPTGKRPRYPTDLELAMKGNLRSMLRLMTDDPKTFAKRIEDFKQAFIKKHGLKE